MAEQLVSFEVKVEGMDCTNCALGIERHLAKMGIQNASVDFASSTLELQVDDEAEITRAIEEIHKLGYRTDRQERPSRWDLTIEQKLFISALFTAPLLLHMAVPWQLFHTHVVQLLLSLPPFIIGFLHFGRSALASLRARLPNMDVLIFIGINSSFIYSAVGGVLGLGHESLFYETAASIVTLVLLGNYLEKRAVRRTTSAVQSLMALQPNEAKRISIGIGKEIITTINAKEIEEGDRLLVNTGDRIPADGVVYNGEGLVDESMISGESLPVSKKKEDKVIGGTNLVEGSIKMTANAVGEKSVLSHIIRLVRETKRNQPGIQRIGDVVAAYFVPAVSTVALLTLVISLFSGVPLQSSLLRAIAVLVIACPCAMGLATPTAVMVGLGRAAGGGILIRGGETIEKVTKIDTIVFDKTGTLTKNEIKVTNAQFENLAADEILPFVKALELRSTHPLAKAIVRYCDSVEPAELTEIREQVGLGISGKDAEGITWKVGSHKITGRDIEPTHSVYVVRDEIVVALLDVEDQIREEAPAVIEILQKQGYKTVLLSGDRRERCEQFASVCGIKNVYSEQSPEDKLEVVAELSRNGRVMYVGDGINDAPALARASVGVSLSNATDVAMQSAQIVLLHNDLALLLSALDLSKLTYSTIKQNLFWAFFYNVCAIPVAAVGLLTPTIAALAMAFSDVIVLGNSLWLKRKRLPNG